VIEDNGIYLNLNSSTYSASDIFLLDMHTFNHQNPLTCHIFIFLDVYGEYWFWPSWISLADGIDFRTESIPAGRSANESILNFIWPENSGAAENILFWAGLLEEGTTTVWGNIAHVSFNFQ